MTSLYDPLNLGGLMLPNRVLMTPLTRNRAGGARPVGISLLPPTRIRGPNHFRSDADLAHG